MVIIPPPVEKVFSLLAELLPRLVKKGKMGGQDGYNTAASALIVNANTVTLEGNTIAVNVAPTGNIIRNNDLFLIVDAAKPILYNTKLSILNDSTLPMITFTDL
jgi:hypothetical protein